MQKAIVHELLVISYGLTGSQFTRSLKAGKP